MRTNDVLLDKNISFALNAGENSGKGTNMLGIKSQKRDQKLKLWNLFCQAGLHILFTVTICCSSILSGRKKNLEELEIRPISMGFHGMLGPGPSLDHSNSSLQVDGALTAQLWFRPNIPSGEPKTQHLYHVLPSFSLFHPPASRASRCIYILGRITTMHQPEIRFLGILTPNPNHHSRVRSRREVVKIYPNLRDSET